MTGLVIVPPLPVTDAILTATDVPEADYAAYAAGTAYGLTARVISAATHKVYESAAEVAVATVTISNGGGAAPGVVSWTGHGLSPADPVVFATTGALPAPLVAGTTYYVRQPLKSLGADSFQLAATPAGAVINTSTAGSGVHTASAGLGADPTDDDNIGTWWLEVSPTNRWKLFDASNSTKTAQATGFYYELTPGDAISTVFAGGFEDADTIRARLTDSVAGVVYDQTVDLASLPAYATWWDWWFGRRTQPGQALFNDLPAYPAAVLRVDVAGGAALAAGVLMMGQGTEFGTGIRYGARVGLQDFSRKETNEWGDVELVERAYAKTMQFTLRLSSDEIDSLQNFLASIRAVPVLFVAYDGLESTVIFGFYKSFEILIAYPTYAECVLDVEGLT